MLIGLNPYGLTYTVGLQGAGTPRANQSPIGLEGFIDVARESRAQCIELHGGWFDAMADADLARLGARLTDLAMKPIVSAALTHQQEETLERPIRWARLLRAPLIRL